MSRVLIVDDSSTILFKLRRDIEELGHEVTTASTLEVALSRARICRPDLVLLDLEMAPHDGLEIGVALLEEIPSVSIIVHSSKPTARLLAAANELQAVGIVRKGQPRSRLQRVIDRSLQLRVSTRELSA